MATAAAAKSSYRPTPLERAYASHLLSVYFQTPFDPLSNTHASDDAELIRVPGRNAVPFLTTSGVERSLLRLLWQVSDPDAVGTLTRRSQFYMLLRLVAMAQAHFLPPLPSPGQPGGIVDEAKLALLRQTLEGNARLVVALPTFTADQSPSVAYLLGTYPPPAVEDVVVAAADHDLQYRLWQKQQQGGGSDSAAVEEAGRIARMSVSDAFGSLPEVEDRPLPSLQAPLPTAVEEGADGMPDVDGDDFGNFDSVQPIQETNQLEQQPQADDQGAAVIAEQGHFGDFDSVPAESMGTADFMGDGNDFGTFDSVQSIHSMGGTAPTDIMVAGNAGDGFGNFDSVPAQPTGETTEASNLWQQARTDIGNFDSLPIETSTAAKGANDQLGEPQTAPSMDDGAVVMPDVQQAPNNVDESDFGDFGGAPTEAGSTRQMEAVMDVVLGEQMMVNDTGENYFVGFASVPNPPNRVIQNAGLTGANEINSIATGEIKMESSAEGAEEGDDSFGAFGGFEAADGILPTPGEQPMPVKNDCISDITDRGEITLSGAVAPAEGGMLSISDVFDSSVEHNQDAAAGIAANTNDDGVPPSSVTDRVDNFGEFEGTEEIEVNEKEEAGDDASRDSGTGQNSNCGVARDNEGMTSGFFAYQNNVDTHEPETTSSDEPAHKLSVFDELVEIQDAPLPPLGFATGNEAAQIEEAKEVVNDSFGDFAGHCSPEDKVVDDARGLGDFGSRQGSANDDHDFVGNAGTPTEPRFSSTQDFPASGSDIAASEDAEAEEDGELGDFEAPEQGPSENNAPPKEELAPNGENNATDLDVSSPATAAENVRKSDDKAVGRLSVFDDLIEIQDAPLPPLTSFSSGINEAGVQDEAAPPLGYSRENEIEAQDSLSHPLGSFSGGNKELTQSEEAQVRDDGFSDFKSLEQASEGNDFVEEQKTNPCHAEEFEGSGGQDELQAAEVEHVVTGDSTDYNADILGTSDNDGDNLASVFGDVFGEVQDAPLPTLGDFSSMGVTASVNNIRDTEEVVDDDGFGDFKGTVHKDGDVTAEAPHIAFDAFLSSNAPLPPMPSFESFIAPGEMKSGKDEIGDDGFGGFEGPTEPLPDTNADSNEIIAVNHVASEVDIDFGDFDANNDTTKQEEEDTNPDQLGAFEEVNARSAVDNRIEFAAEGVAANRSKFIGTNSDLPTFDAFREVPPPPFTAEEEGEVITFGDFGGHAEAMQENDDEEERVGQFDALPVTESKKEAEENNEDESFRQFEAFPVKPVSDVLWKEGVENFGQFGTLQAQAVVDKNVLKTDVEDNFGKLEAFTVPANVDVQENENFGQLEAIPAVDDQDVQKNDENDDFGQFEALPAAAHEGVQKNDEDVSFGQFEAFTAAADEDVQEDDKDDQLRDFPAAAGAIMLQNEDEKFGQFKAFPTTSAKGNVQNNENGNLGQFATFPDVIEDSVQGNDKDDNFEQFDAFPAAANEDVGKNVENKNLRKMEAQADVEESPYYDTSPKNEDNRFGQLETVQDGAAQKKDEDDNFGQFEAFPAATKDDESFGKFEAHANADELPGNGVSPSVDNQSSSGSRNDDFGTFEGVKNVQYTDGTASHAVVESEDDFGDGFGDFSSFDDATSQPIPDKKGDLKDILCSNLGDEFSKLPGLYSVIVSAVESDLQRGIKIVDYVSNKLSAKDKAVIITSRKLQDHICGLAEYMRIVRSIAATIGELLSVNKNIDVEESTLTQWNNNPIIADVIVVEYLWAEIISKAVAMKIFSQAPKLESVVEIRARAVSFDACQKGDFCQLTLQPLEEGEGTRSPVVWNGKTYMACAANFCANRVGQHQI
eukprot:CAMPEP_0172548586 /NCGR_PEP_ID=MMETSP1067-20121228/17837_1 /TAXON_ID=265564 ORGANISM="Thalassiosira punctigera, Strain Tpunct2005C2" /NCGR_SAMPLE_ID=MMETSP1067 /ASSEMBLY_ACC=CAM_ASM_000444 /LENGTH=1816 /DNA_ID=CAMNT_0013335821 /DNA_START=16 /DNA_END=5466 /DNA_ORIENTATION=-